MKRRIRTIFILMTACILGINLFQGYWLYTTYTFHRQQFTRIGMEALQAALFQYHEADARHLFTREIIETTTDSIANRRVFKQIQTTSEVPDPVLVIRDEAHFPPTMAPAEPGSGPMDVMQFRFDPGPAAGMIPADTLAHRISRRIIVNWFGNAPFDIQQMDSTYRRELKLRGLDAPFRLDTLLLPQTGPVMVSQRAGVQAHPAVQDYPVQLQPVPVNPVRNLFLQASFGQPMPYILQQMGGLLASSILLLALTTGCFLYMLSTILRQKKLSEIKNDFINNMTHELKTPLATVSAAVEAMQSFGVLNDPPKAQLYLTVSRNELQRLSGLVEKVLNMAVEEQKETEIRPEAFHPAELIREIVSRHQLKAPKPVQFDLHLSESEQPLRADRMHVCNAISNLIDNAINYSRENVHIRIRSQFQRNEWQLSVKDNGIGIPKSYQRAVFERFFRVPTGDLHPVKGFGLGLSYVKQVVEKHGGRIELHSEAGQGSEFILHFPSN